jgi:hypothetical protein
VYFYLLRTGFYAMPSEISMECRISEINGGRVRLMGTIVERQPAEGVVVLDDGTGQVKVFFDQLELLEKIGEYNTGDRVFICGWAMDQGISGDIIKSANDLDLGLYEQVRARWAPLCKSGGGNEDV